ncbi:hypothetical protein ACQ4LE_008794 [Meloidogyne hapla]|uniref:Uncharacterized protein n=1 Tax=Meloidogyne hapla TaxID=6305 RepID=A0A1I8BVF9_MELHA
MSNNTTTTNNSLKINSSSNILDKVKQFLPQIAEANEKLKDDKTKNSILIERLDKELKSETDSSSSSEDSDETSDGDSCDSDDECQSKDSNREPRKFVQFDVHLFEEKDENKEEKKLVVETSKTD